MEQATLKPSARRLREARRRGIVPVSRSLLSAVALVGAAVVLHVAWPDVLAHLTQDMRGWMVLAPAAGVPPWAALQSAMQTMAVVLCPVLAAALLCALVSGLLQTRGMFSLEPLRPRLGRLAPGRAGAGGRAWRSLMSLTGVLGVGALAALTLWQHGERLLATAGEAPAVALSLTLVCLLEMALKVGLLLLALAVLDVVYQRWSHGSRLRMTRREALREKRETEGDPWHRDQRRLLHQRIIAGRDLAAVERADCVISGGPGLAVALRYDQDTMDAPRVLLVGAGKAAASVRAEARRHGRPVVHRRPLARALALQEPDTDIPRRLWEEVAGVWRQIRKGQLNTELTERTED